jgi:hypothetical protein
MILSVIVPADQRPRGRNSVVECHLAKVDVDGSNPFARSRRIGGIAKWQGSGLQNRYSPVQIWLPPPNKIKGLSPGNNPFFLGGEDK